MVNKKGLELHFHWIIVLIAGAVILFFFFSVVQKQRSFSEERLSIALSRDIEAVFSSAVESKGTSQVLSIPKGGIAFSCSEVCDCNFWIGDKATQFGDNIIFAPDFLSQGSAIAWSLDWKVPFRAANFLFLQGVFDEYFVVVDSSDSSSLGFLRELNRSLPSDVILRVISLPEVSEVVPENNVKYRFIFLNSLVSSPFGLSGEFADADVSVVFLNSDDRSVTFYEKSERDLRFDADTSLYLGDAGVFAAVFAEDKDMFECNLKQAFFRLSVVADILDKRAGVLDDQMNKINRSDCIYSAPGMNYFRDISSYARELSLSSSFVDMSGVFDQLAAAVDGVESLNRNLIQQSCPGIF